MEKNKLQRRTYTYIGLITGLILSLIIFFTFVKQQPNTNNIQPIVNSSNYIGNADGSDWAGYTSGSLKIEIIKQSNDANHGTCAIVDARTNKYSANNLAIPNIVQINTNLYDVVRINAYAFSGVNNSLLIGTLTFPSALTEIQNYAFNECNKLIGDLIIPNSVTTIGDGAFSGCDGFNGSLIIPNSVTAIGELAFANCAGFTGDLIIPNRLTKINESTFTRCSGFTGRLVIPSTVTAIASNAFSYAKKISRITFTNSAYTINTNAFYGLDKLSNIVFDGWNSLPGNKWVNNIFNGSKNRSGIVESINGSLASSAILEYLTSHNNSDFQTWTAV